jgi:sugar lactone lactonase YvrE
MPVVHKDTLRLVPPVQLVADVSAGEVHFDAERGGLAVMVEPSDASSNGLAAAGHRLVVRRRGTEIMALDDHGK